MEERFFLSLIIVGGFGLLWPGWRFYKQRVAQSIQPLETAPGTPTLLYFSSNYCAACKLQQAPIVEQLAAKWGAELVIKKYDVTEHPDLARQYKILSLPATVVLNRQGQVVHLNYGLTSLTQLEEQLW